MKKISLVIAASLLAVLTSAAGNYIGLITPSTNLTFSVGAGVNTNTAGALTNNQFSGVVANATTNYYTLSTGIGTQSATNVWPSAGFTLIGYPNTLYGPFNNTEFYINGGLLASNASSTAIVVRFAGSIDGANWYSNYFALPYTIPATAVTTIGPWVTNTATGGMPFMCIQQVENPGANVLSNLTVEVVGKPGL